MKEHAFELQAMVSLIVIVVALGTLSFHALEDWSWVESYYFTVTTTTTVGYGDLHPTHPLSQVVATVFMIVGSGILVTVVGYIGAFFINRRTNKIKHRVEDSRQ